MTLRADIVAFRCAASNDVEEGEEIVLLRAEKLMQDILYITEAQEYRAFLTGSNNFRKQINPEYKANRKDKPLPMWLKSCRDYLVKEWNAEITDGYEADDALGVAQTPDTIVCSIDKDLLQIPGRHYNFVKQEFQEVLEADGVRHFYKQLIIGDRSDNIFGVKGAGPVKASKLIDHLDNQEEMYECVKDLYDSEERLIMNGQCLWIWRKENDIWQPPLS